MAAAPGTVRSESIRFTEAAGSAAGVYTGSFVVPDGATLVDVIVQARALWTAGTAATLIVGDSVDDDGLFAAVNLKATDLLATESISLAYPGGKFGADVAVDYTSVATIGASQVKRRSIAGARTLQAKVTTTGTVGTGGITDVIFVYAYPNPITPTFVAS